MSDSCVSAAVPADFSVMRVFLGRSGVDPLLLKELRVRSLELALLLEVALSEGPAPFLSGDCSLWDDLEAMRFEKKDLEGSRPCFGDPGGDSGYCGIADMVGEVGPIISVRCEPSVVVLSLPAMLRPVLESFKYGDDGTDVGLRGDVGDVGLIVEAVEGCWPSGLDLTALRLSDGGPFVRCIVAPMTVQAGAAGQLPAEEDSRARPCFKMLVHARSCNCVRGVSRCVRFSSETANRDLDCVGRYGWGCRGAFTQSEICRTVSTARSSGVVSGHYRGGPSFLLFAATATDSLGGVKVGAVQEYIQSQNAREIQLRRVLG